MARTAKRTTTTQAPTSDRTTDLAQQLITAVTALQSGENFAQLLRWQTAFHHYSARNCLLIKLQRPRATQVASYRTWQTLGRQVVKGATGIKIFAPRVKKAVTLDDQPHIYFAVTHVFDIADTRGDPLPTTETPTLDGAGDQDAYDRLSAFAEADGLTITTTPEAPTAAQGYYAAGRQEIYVQPASSAQMLCVLIHELAHHLDRARWGTAPEDETVAEGVAFMVCAACGIDTGTASFPYIAHWSASEGGEAIILRCPDRIQAVARQLIGVVRPTDDQAEPLADESTTTPTRAVAA